MRADPKKHLVLTMPTGTEQADEDLEAALNMWEKKGYAVKGLSTCEMPIFDHRGKLIERRTMATVIMARGD